MSKAMGVSVLLPVCQCEPSLLERSMRSVCGQSHESLEILVLLNGTDEATRTCAHWLCARDGRTRVVEIEQAGLARALNVGLREAKHEFVARMDADDECHVRRVERQLAAMAVRPEVAALGTAYSVVGRGGERLGVVTPPSDPSEARWRLLVSNPFAHGSMMLRRSAVLAVGGYDESFERAQDYELWVRLSSRGGRSGVSALPEVLYTLTRPDEVRAFGSTELQGVYAAKVLERAWGSLERGEAGAIAGALASMAERGDVEPGRRAIEDRMRAGGPTLTDLLAWLWGSWTSPGSHVRAFDVARAARVREVGRALGEAGVSGVWLWGAGRHTDWLLTQADELSVPIIGIVDDALAGQERFGLAVQSPTAMAEGEHVLLSSDWHEEAMWSRSGPVRASGVTVWRLYGEPMSSRAPLHAAA